MDPADAILVALLKVEPTSSAILGVDYVVHSRCWVAPCSSMCHACHGTRSFARDKFVLRLASAVGDSERLRAISLDLCEPDMNLL